MSLLGGIGLVAAIANYRRAKKVYEDALKDSNDPVITAAIEQYDNSKYDKLDEYDKQYNNPNATFENLLPIPVLNVGMLVGSKFRIKPQVVLKSLSDQKIKLYGFGVIMYVLEKPFLYASNDYLRVTIPPFASEEITFPLPTIEQIESSWLYENTILGKAISESMEDVWSITDELQKIKEYLSEKYKSSWNSPIETPLNIPNNTILTQLYGKDVVTADVEIMYATEDNHDIRRALYKGCKGSFVYKGEAYYPGGGKWIF